MGEHVRMTSSLLSVREISGTAKAFELSILSGWRVSCCVPPKATRSLDASRFRGGEALYQVVTRACQQNKADRYGTAAEFNRAWLVAGA
jgi:hypothetical protein